MARAADANSRRGSLRLVELLRWIGDVLLLLPRGAGVILALAWMGLIFELSTVPGSHLPAPTWWIGILANGVHAPLYGLLGLWIALAMPRFAGWPKLDRRHVAWVIALTVLYGASDEFHQSFTEGRDSSVLDLITDFTGVSCVMWIATYLNQDRARDSGLLVRLAAGVALCTLAASGAAFIGPLFPELTWL